MSKKRTVKEVKTPKESKYQGIYRLLLIGEIIIQTDEFYNASENKWTRLPEGLVNTKNEPQYAPIRRPLIVKELSYM